MLNFENKIFEDNLNKNRILLNKFKSEHKIKFIPPEYLLEIFPNEQIMNFYKNKNNKRWGNIIDFSELSKLNQPLKDDVLTSLLKIYYAIGGFSENQGESEKAHNFLLNFVLKNLSHLTIEEKGQFIIDKFSGINLSGEYNREFANFFMKYYKDNSDFMKFALKDKNDNELPTMDYLCDVHNRFDKILQLYPYRTISGNKNRETLTPEFLAKHSRFVKYENVDVGNESLAQFIGEYSFSQNDFDKIQFLYNYAKSIKYKSVIKADSVLDENNEISFRVLEKDDPLGFVIGDITNCCQSINDVGESCVRDGFMNPNSGFIVFEQNVTNNVSNSEMKRIVGQAFVWYDPETRTVCLDNIEIPNKILKELHEGDKNNSQFSTNAFIEILKQCSFSLIKKMNESGTRVERVTTGEGYNKLINELKKNFKKEKNPKSQNRSSAVSDARSAQFIIANYKDVTTQIAKTILSSANNIINNIEFIKNNQQYNYMQR